MTLLVDTCPNFDGRLCTKCGRSLPDFCHDQEELERKSKAYDQMMAIQASQVEPKSEESAKEAEDEPELPLEAPKAKPAAKPKAKSE